MSFTKETTPILGSTSDGHKISVTQQHSRFLLDERPIRWKDDVWIWWHADDGFILERYKEKENENP